MSKVSSRPASSPVPSAVRTEASAAPRATNAVRQQTPYQVADGLDVSKAGTRPPVSLDVPTPRQAQAVTGRDGRAPDGKRAIRVETGVADGPWGSTVHQYIEIRVKPLDLGIAPGQLQSELDRASAEKLADDEKAYGADMRAAGYSSLQEWSEDRGYYGSPSHVAWAEAASARTGGQIPAEWWMRFDPFGGTAGNGPNILPTGEYPGLASRIAMCHDTDWDLGRYFGAGPLRQLQGAENAQDLGPLGLDPRLGGELYTFGHADWDVTYGEEVQRSGG
ncbi:hypothetical protein [Corallococcus carmarthensis]|uniref:Uncharacterized protein n=1 Tax=Corallococcus carmarthensis TaxID=2316728 RepID=A0A3A8KQT1_9BACT|nr:hypothetical protein [Corallococcus carmarthensis]NOK16285.1 hypothetical protein [Corallococcus carmarthensis]RKH06535.1 hypothetical protein D7X32_04975 [Corallococcus carmarthensis]